MNCSCNLDEIKKDLTNPPLDCALTWQLFSEGNTKAVFQLETQLGQSLSKKLKPENMEHLSALISIMRPGVLESSILGKSLTDHYIDRKNYKEPVEYFHTALEPILKSTLGIMIYQEEAIRIGTDIAGMSLADSDTYIRRGIGKKKPEVIAKAKKLFLAGCKKTEIVSKEEAIDIFEWIQKGQRYLFCKSHAMAYAHNSYLTAFCKAHFPQQFFVSYLQHSKSKPNQKQEIKELVSNMKVMEIPIQPPNLCIGNEKCNLINNKIYFGLTDIKGLGSKVFIKFTEILKNIEEFLHKDLSKWTWSEFLVCFARKAGHTPIEGMIESGALDFFELDRAVMMQDYNILMELREREQLWMQNIILNSNGLTFSFIELLTKLVEAPTGKGGGIYHKKRVPLIDSMSKVLLNPPYLVHNSPTRQANKERTLLGINITEHKLNSYDCSMATHMCVDIMRDNVASNLGKKSSWLTLVVEIEAVREYRIKKGDYKGQFMCFLEVSDQSCILDSVALFTECYSTYKDLLFIGNVIFIVGFMGKKGLIVQKISQL